MYFNRLIEATNFQLSEIKKRNLILQKMKKLWLMMRKVWRKNKFELKSWKKISKNDVFSLMLANNNLDEATSLINKRYSNRLKELDNVIKKMFFQCNE